jgi:hypothetical protein
MNDLDKLIDKVLEEALVDQILPFLKRILKGAGKDPEEVPESSLLRLIKEVRFDVLGKKRDSIVNDLIAGLGLDDTVANKMYDVVDRLA